MVSKAQVGEYRINYYTVPIEGFKMTVPEAKVYLLECGLKVGQIRKLFEVKEQHTLRITVPKSSADEETD
jgi:hypothetical protein